MNHNPKCTTRVEEWAAAVIICICSFSGTATAQGGDMAWNEPAGGIFSEPANWAGGVVPGPWDRSIFDLNSTYTVTLDRAEQNQYVLAKSGNVTFDLSGFVFRNFLSPSGSSERRMVVGDLNGDNAELTIMGGEWHATGDFIVGWNEGSIGVLNITGVTTAVLDGEGEPRVNDRIRVGLFGDGTLRITGGARVYKSLVISDGDAAGRALVSDQGTALYGDLFVGGTDGTAFFELANGAIVNETVLPVIRIGAGLNSRGEVLVRDPGSKLMGSVFLGESGEGHLTVASGAMLITSTLSIGGQGAGRGSALVTGLDTQVEADQIRIGGRASTGTLLVEDGARVVLDDSISVAGEANLVGVSGVGTYLESKGFDVGGFGFGSAAIVANGATVVIPNNGISVTGGHLLITDVGTTVSDTSLDGVGVFGDADSGEGVLVANGASLTAAFLTVANVVGEPLLDVSDEGTSLRVTTLARVGHVGRGMLLVREGASACIEVLEVGEGGVVEGEITVGGCGLGLSGPGINSATLDVSDTGVLTDPDIDVLTGGTLMGDGVIPGNVVNRGGRVAPGGLNDTLTIVGDYDQLDLAGMTIGVRGRNPGEFDRLDVVGTARLSGELLCQVHDQTTLEPGIRFEFLFASSVEGRFDSQRISRPDGLRPVPSYGADRVTITISEGLTLNSSALIKGQDATIRVSNSVPNAQTWLIYSLGGTGATYIDQLDVTAGVRAPTLAAGPIRANAQGEATLTVRVPNISGTPRVWLQAVQRRDASTVVSKRIQD